MTAPYKPKPLPTVRFKDLMAKKIKIEWLIENLIPLTATMLLAGDSGVGKTWLLLDLILAVATGGKWLGQLKCKKGAVLVFDEENAEVLIQDRLRQLCAARGIGKLDDLPIEFVIGQMIDLTPLKDSRNGEQTPSPQFLDLLATAHQVKPTLITFDSFIRIHHANENQSNEMKGVSSQIGRLARETGGTCVISHHFVKSGSGASGHRIRGSGDIRAFVDLNFLVNEGKDKTIAITHDKPRWTKKIDPFTVKMSQDERRGTFNVVYVGSKPQVKRQTPWEFLSGFLSKGSKTRAEIVKKAEGTFSARRIDEELAYRKKSGDVAKNTQDRKSVV